MKAKAIFTYSSVERHRHEIAGAETHLGRFLFMFPLIPILLALFSCFVIWIPDEIYRRLFGAGTALAILLFLFQMVRWIRELLTVYMIGEDGEFYRLYVSVFWYQVKDCMDLIQPEKMTKGRLTRLFYMIQHIRSALERSGDISFEELIEMGRLTRFSHIREVKGTKKYISFCAELENKKGNRTRKIRIRNVYDVPESMECYLKVYEKKGMEAAGKANIQVKRTVEELLGRERTPAEKLGRFVFIWTGIMLWVSLFTIVPDLNKLGKINANQVVLTEVAVKPGKETETYIGTYTYGEKAFTIRVAASLIEKGVDTVQIYLNRENPYAYFFARHYGVSYQPMCILYLTVLAIKLFSSLTQLLIDGIKKTKG